MANHNHYIVNQDADINQLQPVWAMVREGLGQQIPASDFRSWIDRLQAIPVDEDRVALIAPNTFSRDWIQENLFDLICKLWMKSDPQNRSLSLQVASGKVTATNTDAEAKKTDQASMSVADTAGHKYRFDNFVVGPSNEVAWAVSKQAARGPQSRFNPLFIHGGYGLGKTHLLRAIAHQSRIQSPTKKVLFLTAEAFVQKFVTSLRGTQSLEFKKNFRSLDLLLIDDLHFLAGKTATQEEFVHTLGSLIESGSQVVLSADRSPGEIAALDDRLRSHLSGGLVCRIAPAAFELRREILVQQVEEMKTEFENFKVPDDVLDFLASKICSSPRELLGALNMVVSGTVLIGRPVTLEQARDILSDVVRATRVKVSISDIKNGTTSWFGLGKEDLLSRRKTRNIVRPRQIAMYLAKELTSCSLPMIGQRFGGRDHTTVIHAIKTIQKLIAEDTALADEVEGLRRSLTKLQS